ncbi:MAG: undecaprenyl-diphosphate phosphatase [Candidatus Hydrogenedentes bacterium]|nr:undecaprenyl-diphosphate phosphatase [Candidatus Hydrogenedentota bacterium]
MDILKAILLAVVEGVTEFLPISSTGHMILVEDLFQFDQPADFAKAFLVIIQLPAILAVVAYFWKEIWPFQRSEDHFWSTFRLWTRIVAAFIPAAILGFLFDDYIEEKLFSPTVVAWALIVGGIVLIAIEMIRRRTRVDSVHDLGYATAVCIGFFQCLAMIPGTSRSAATIIGAMALGASRSAAAEFSFFLAIPTMFGATALTVLKHGLSFTPYQWTLLSIGSLVSFLVAYGVVALFMKYIRRHTFIPFGWYRIALGVIVLWLLWD